MAAAVCVYFFAIFIETQHTMRNTKKPLKWLQNDLRNGRLQRCTCPKIKKKNPSKKSKKKKKRKNNINNFRWSYFRIFGSHAHIRTLAANTIMDYYYFYFISVVEEISEFIVVCHQQTIYLVSNREKKTKK